MKALIVYESLFGNTKTIAESIACGLQTRCDARIESVADVTPQIVTGADLLVLGAPTHAHGLSRQGTRTQTMSKGVSRALSSAVGMREFMHTLPNAAGKPAAAFDTRLRGPRWLWGSASSKIADTLTGLGYQLLARGMSFTVRGASGPLVDGQTTAAELWGRRLAELVADGHADAA
jgi:hypothetical protein